MVGENGPPMAGWRDPRTDPAPILPPRCCGTFSESLVCTVCGQWVSLGPGEN